MAAFTVCTTGDYWQKIDPYWEEITNAYDERHAAADLSGTLTVARGTVIQNHQFWEDIQTEIETLIPYYVDDTADPEDTDAPVMWTVAAFKSEFFVSTDWRRSINHTTFITGKCARGDYIDWWLIEDIQIALAGLKITAVTATGNSASPSIVWSGSAPYGSCATQLEDARDEYTDDGGSRPTSSTFYRWGRRALINEYSEYRFDTDVIHSRARGVVPDPEIAFDWEFFAVSIPYSSGSFLDEEALGFIEDKMASLETGNEVASTTTFDTDEIGGASKPANPLTSWGCPMSAITEGVTTTDGYFFISWDFTYA